MTEVEHRELDARVACEVMGWDVRSVDVHRGDEFLFVRPSGYGDHDELRDMYVGDYYLDTNNENRPTRIPPFSGDLNAAELVLLRIKDLQRRSALAHELRKLIGVTDDYESLSFLFFRNKAELICRAALKAIKYD